MSQSALRRGTPASGREPSPCRDRSTATAKFPSTSLEGRASLSAAQAAVPPTATARMRSRQQRPRAKPTRASAAIPGRLFLPTARARQQTRAEPRPKSHEFDSPWAWDRHRTTRDGGQAAVGWQHSTLTQLLAMYPSEFPTKSRASWRLHGWSSANSHLSLLTSTHSPRPAVPASAPRSYSSAPSALLTSRGLENTESGTLYVKRSTSHEGVSTFPPAAIRIFSAFNPRTVLL